MKISAYLLLGTNIGDRNINLSVALSAIAERAGKVGRKSSVYETAAWGKTDQEPFYNQVVELETSKDPDALLDCVLDIERKMGRHRAEPWGARIIDIDILFYDNAIIETGQLTIPHPQLANRRFTLEPLNEIAPDLIHPKFQKSISQLLEMCPDTLRVTKL